MDPLSALREYTTRNSLDKIMSVGGDLHFGNDYSFPSKTPTSYRSKQGNLYTLETVLFLLRNQSLKHVDYMHATHSAGVPPVTLPDRKPLIDYLHGRLPTLDQIDPSAAVILADSNLNDVSNVNITNNFEFSDDKTEAVPAAVIRKRERPLKDREAVLECRNKDFYKVYVQGMKREEEKMRSEMQGRKDGLVAKTRLTVNEGFDGGEKASVMKGVPIILVPSASQTLITIYNVKEFLEDGVFVTSDVKAKGAGGKPECVTVQKRLGSKDSRGVAAYEVRDKAVGFKQEDWDRVVAVFVLGKEWQFKDWPYTNPVEIFNKIIGFYVRFEDDSIESAKTVKQWNVKIISISKNKRHQDRAAALEVWDRLEAFMRSRSHT